MLMLHDRNIDKFKNFSTITSEILQIAVVVKV
jgi:hypothetical protein